MSLINDALKRAKLAQQTSPPPTSPGPVLRPVEPVRRKDPSLAILLPLALVVLVGVGGLIIWFAMRPGSAKKSPSSVASMKPAPAPVIQSTPKPAASPPSPVVAASESNPATNPLPVASATTTTTSPIAVVSEPPPPPPLPKLQGIFYRPERPAALLNGKTVLVGGTSGEHHVVAISQQSVTVVRSGQTNVLEMPD
jgi:hypothetical protein